MLDPLWLGCGASPWPPSPWNSTPTRLVVEATGGYAQTMLNMLLAAAIPARRIEAVASNPTRLQGASGSGGAVDQAAMGCFDTHCVALTEQPRFALTGSIGT